MGPISKSILSSQIRQPMTKKLIYLETFQCLQKLESFLKFFSHRISKCVSCVPGCNNGSALAL